MKKETIPDMFLIAKPFSGHQPRQTSCISITNHYNLTKHTTIGKVPVILLVIVLLCHFGTKAQTNRGDVSTSPLLYFVSDNNL